MWRPKRAVCAENTAWKPTRRSILLASVPLLVGSVPQMASIEEGSMAQSDQDFGRLNAKAPAELSRFTFLIGKWQCEANLMLANGTWQTFKAAWLGRYILDGYAIADEYRMLGPSGDLIVLGMNLRTYDAIKRTWNIRWLNGLAGDWTDLVSEQLGGVKVDGSSIIYAFKEPVAGHVYTRATYTAHSKTHFTWRGEKSDDGKSWSEFMIVEAVREK
jgi:hypothetical protein